VTTKKIACFCMGRVGMLPQGFDSYESQLVWKDLLTFLMHIDAGM